MLPFDSKIKFANATCGTGCYAVAVLFVLIPLSGLLSWTPAQEEYSHETSYRVFAATLAETFHDEEHRNAMVAADDSISWYAGAVMIQMRDDSVIPRFGIRVAMETIPDAQQRHTALTDDEGSYFFRALEAGQYRRTVEIDDIAIYADTLTLTGPAARELETLIIPVSRLEEAME